MMKAKLKFTGLDANRRIANLIILSVLFSLVFSISIFVRGYFLGNNSLPGTDAYFSVNVARDIVNFRDNPAIDSGAVPELIWPLFIAFFSIIFRVHEEFSIIALSLIFGILSLILTYFIIDKLGFRKRNLAIAFFLISPATIWMFSTYSKFILPFFFSLLTLYLLLAGKYAISLIMLGITCLFGAVSGLSVIVFSVLGFKKGFWNWLWKAIIIFFVLTSIIYFLFPVFPEFSFSLENIFSLFSSLSEYGINLFAFLLAFIGIVITWRERRERRELFLIYIVFIILLALSILNKDFVFFFNFILIFLAAIGFTKLLERNWASGLIKGLALLILIIGLATPLIVMPLRIASSAPGNDMLEALKFLRPQEGGAVLSAGENGHWIEGIARKEVFIDGFKSRIDPVLEAEALALLRERNIERLNREFSSKGIKYILLDPSTRKIFRTKDEGILLLLLYTDRFEKVYDKDSIEIWKFRAAV